MKRALFIGRWQPLHDGHRWLFAQKLDAGAGKFFPSLLKAPSRPTAAGTRNAK